MWPLCRLSYQRWRRPGPMMCSNSMKPGVLCANDATNAGCGRSCVVAPASLMISCLGAAMENGPAKKSSNRGLCDRGPQRTELSPSMGQGSACIPPMSLLERFLESISRGASPRDPLRSRQRQRTGLPYGALVLYIATKASTLCLQDALIFKERCLPSHGHQLVYH